MLLFYSNQPAAPQFVILVNTRDPPSATIQEQSSLVLLAY